MAHRPPADMGPQYRRPDRSPFTRKVGSAPVARPAPRRRPLAAVLVRGARTGSRHVVLFPAFLLNRFSHRPHKGNLAPWKNLKLGAKGEGIF